jgi:O-antigen/teichoic acid export membrane protein
MGPTALNAGRDAAGRGMGGQIDQPDGARTPTSVTRDTFKHAAVYSVAAMAGRLIGFLMLPFYAHILRDLGYGVIGMVDAAMTFLVSLIGHGIVDAITRIYHEEEGERKNLVISTALWLYGVVGLALVLPLVLLADPLSHLLLGEAGHGGLLRLALITFSLEITGLAAGSVLIIRRRSILFSGLSLLRLLTGLGLNIYLIVMLRWGLWGYFVSALGTAVVATLLAGVVAARWCGLQFDRDIARKLIHFQAPLIPGSLATFASRQAERLLVRFQVGLAAVGVLEMGYKLSWLIGMLVNIPFINAWNTKRTEIALQADAPTRLGRLFTYFVFLSLLVGLILEMTVQPLLEILTPSEFWGAYRIAQLEILCQILNGCEFHLGFGLYWAKDMKRVSLIRTVLAVIKVGLSYVLIRRWGIYGAAISPALMAGASLVWFAVESQKRYALRIEWRKIGGMVAAAILLFLIVSHLDLRSWLPHVWVREEMVHGTAEWLHGTSAASWKDGRVVEMFESRAMPMTDVIVRTVLGLSYLGLWPLVRRQRPEP